MSLIGHWPLHEWNGQANDLSGNDNHGTVNGATQGVWGRGGLTEYSFDGSDDNVVTTFGNGESGARSISVWIRVADNDNVGIIASPYDGTGYNSHLDVATDRSGNPVRFTRYDGTTTETVSFDLTSITSFNKWIHVVAVYDGGNFQGIYANGKLKDSLSPTVTYTNGADYHIGSDPQSSNFYKGYISDVRVYDRALSPQGVQELYEMGSGDYTRPSLHDGTDSGAVSRYEFTSGSVTADSWGSNTLTDNTSDGTTTDAVYGTDAKSFDGTDDYMDTGYQGDFGTGDFTISLWVRQTNDTSKSRTYIANYDGTGGWGIRSKGGNMNIFVGSFQTTANQSHATDVWYNVTAVREGDTISIYQNGVKLDSNSGSTPSADSSDTVQIGRRPTNFNHLAGDIDDVRIYDRALSSAEVAQLYRQKHGKDMRKELVKK